MQTASVNLVKVYKFGRRDRRALLICSFIQATLLLTCLTGTGCNESNVNSAELNADKKNEVSSSTLALRSIDHLIQIKCALNAYAMENGGRFPYHPYALVKKGLLLEQDLLSPAADSDISPSYFYLPGLDPYRSPDDDIVCYENLRIYDGEGAFVLQMDGSVEWKTAEQIRKRLKIQGVKRIIPVVPQKVDDIKAEENLIAEPESLILSQGLLRIHMVA
jgi:hypothetical protein